MRRTSTPRWAVVAVVGLGGATGCLARYGLTQVAPPSDGWPTATFVTNLVGCALLGGLLEHLARAGEDVGRRRLVRLGLGTGALGSFTTYSTLAVEVDLLTRGGDAVLAVAYGLTTVVLGLVAAGAGVALAGRHARRGSCPPDVPPDVAGQDTQ